jgi:glyoxalase family protein
MPARLPGIHHVTAITADVQACTDFYVGVLGLRFIKKTVNFDVPDTYHIYFGDLVGTPGTAMTFFGWDRWPKTPQGTGQVLAVAFQVPEDAIDFWAGRLRAHKVDHRQERRFGAEVLVFSDPDGIHLELVGQAADDRWQAWPDSPVEPARQIRGFHWVGLLLEDAAPTARFLTGVLGFEQVDEAGDRTRFATGAGGPHAIVELLERPEAAAGVEGTGTVHHVAWRALDDEHELRWREDLVAAGARVTPVIDRKYFHSIYFREPGGVLFEIATDQPGFTVDEPVADLGSGLQLPPHAEASREELKFNLKPIEVPSFSRC